MCHYIILHVLLRSLLFLKRTRSSTFFIPISHVRYGHASAVALVGCGGPGELQDRPPRLQMSPRPSSRLLIRSVHSGFNFRRPYQHALILEVGPTTVRPTNQNKDTGSTRVLLRLVCRVELAPGGLAWSRTLAPLLQNKTEISLFHSWLIFFRFSFMYSIIVYSFFLRRARQRDAH